MLRALSDESKASQPPFSVEDEIAGISSFVRDGIPVSLVSSFAQHEDLRAVLLERIHFSSRRPIQLQLALLGHSGWRQSLLVEWLGSSADAHAQQERRSLSKSRRAQLPRAKTGELVSLSDWGLVVRQPGLDAKLPGLRLLHNPEEVAELLKQFTATAAEPSGVELVAHRLGKRAVLRVSTTNNQVFYIRLRGINSKSGSAGFARHSQLFEQLSAYSAITIPEPLGYSDELGAAVYRELKGRPAVLCGPAAVSESIRISRALNALQSIQQYSYAKHSAVDEYALLLQLFDRTELYFPELARALREPIDRVGVQLRCMPEQPFVVAHRDLHQKQLLMTESRIGLLDFDTVCQSHPALDLGNLQAHVYLEHLRNRHLSAPIEKALTIALKHLTRQEIKVWRCSALLRLAMIYAFTHEPESIVHALIDEASS